MFDGLVLPGGGLKGITLLGALHYLDKETDHLKHIKYYSGTSIGAIIISCMLVGYTPFEMLSKVHSFKDVFKCTLDNLINFTSNFGLKSNEEVIDIVMDHIHKKNENIITLEDLYVHSKKMFYFTVVNIDTQKTIHLNPIDNPDFPLDIALRMTSNLPAIFTKIEWEGEHYIDGMFGENVPITPLINNKEVETILVIRLPPPCPQSFDKDGDSHVTTSIFDYFYKIFNMKLKLNEKNNEKNENKNEKCTYFDITSTSQNILCINTSISDSLKIFNDGCSEMEKLMINHDLEELEKFENW